MVTVIRGGAPQRGPGAPEAESFSAFGSSTAKQNLHSSPPFASCLLTSIGHSMEKAHSPQFFGSMSAIDCQFLINVTFTPRRYLSS